MTCTDFLDQILRHNVRYMCTCFPGIPGDVGAGGGGFELGRWDIDGSYMCSLMAGWEDK